MTRIMNRWWWPRQTWTSKFQDYHIPLWNTRKVLAFDNWFRKLRTTQIDMLFNKIYDRINHLILSVQSQNKWFGMLGTSNFVNYLRRNPKRSAQYVHHTGTLASSYCTCGHFLRKGRGANQQFIKYTMDLLSIPEYVIKKERPHGHRYGKMPGDREYFSANQFEEEVQEKVLPRNSMTDSYEMKHSVIEWLKMVETKMFVDNGMLLQMKSIHTIWLHKNIIITRVIWWLTPNKTGSYTVPVEHRPDFTQAVSTL